MKQILAIGLLLLTACVSLQRDSGAAEVSREVAARTNQDLEIRSSATAAGDERLRTMLSGTLTADQAVAVALMNSPRVGLAMADLGLARADLLEAVSIRNPVLGGEIRFPPSPVRPYELSLSQTVLDLLFLPRRRSAGLAAFEAAKSRTSAAILAIAAEVRADYYDLLAATQHVSMDRLTLESAKAAAELALRQHEAGNITDLDLETEQALYEQAKVDLSRSEEQSLLLRETLIRDMGLHDPLPEWRIADTFPPLPDAERTEAELQASLAARRLDIAAARNDLGAINALLPATRGSALGEVEAGLHRERDSGGEITTGPSLQVPIPIFNRGAAARTRLEAQRLQAEQRLSLLTTAALSETRAARQAVLAARGRVEYYRDVILPRRKRIVELTRLEHNAMVSGTFQLLQARQSEAAARRQAIDAQRDYWMARNNLDRVLNGIADESGDRMTHATPQAPGMTAERRGGH